MTFFLMQIAEQDLLKENNMTNAAEEWVNFFETWPRMMDMGDHRFEMFSFLQVEEEQPYHPLSSFSHLKKAIPLRN